MNFTKIIIAIDGYSACGKSTTAREVAAVLGYRYIDSGAMYRAVTHHFLQHHVTLTNPKEVSKALSQITISFVVNSRNQTETFLNGANVEGDIRKMKVSENVSQISAVRSVREAMVNLQRRMGKDKGIVMDGRDIGTVVFPEAELKLFMTAEMEVRAARRQKELLEREKLVDLQTVIENIRLRDHLDTTREDGPLRKADDATVIDTTNITIEEQVDEVLHMAVSGILAADKNLAINAD
jgi:CMP/dCMP kinase